MKKLLSFIFLICLTGLAFGQAHYDDDSWFHQTNKVTLTIPSDNVGVGSITPGTKLDVTGTVRATNFIGAGTGLTGTASALNIGGNASTSTSTTNINGLSIPASSALIGTNSSSQIISQTGTITNNTSGNAATVTTNANLTGPITSLGNATSIASQTGTGSKFVVDTSPTLITPIIGIATATSINKMAITAPASSSTLAVANSKTFTVNNTLTLGGTDSTTMTFPSTSATIARTDAANNFTGHQTIEGVTSTGATGTGNLVFSASPNFSGNVGIDSVTPGQALDVQGTIRTTNFTMTGQTPTSGYVLTSDSSGNGSWQASSGGGGANYWSLSPGNTGIGTTNNVGIGTISPTDYLQVQGIASGGITINSVSSGVGGCDSGTLALWHLDTDYSDSNCSGAGAVSTTPLGDATIGTPAKFGTGASQSTSTGYFSAGTTSTFIKLHNVGSFPKWYISFWWKPVFSGGEQDLIHTGNPGIYFYMNSNKSLTITLENATQNIISATSSAGAVPNDTTAFHNYEIDYDNTLGSNNMNIYVDGVNVIASTKNADTPTSSPQGSVMNIQGFSGSQICTGSMDEFIIYSGSVLHTTNFTPNTMPFSSPNTTTTLSLSGSGVKIGQLQSNSSNSSTSLIDNNITALTSSSTGNIGIDSVNPGQTLDVNGTVRTIGFTLSTSPTSGYVLTTNSVGVGTWAPASGGSGTVTSSGSPVFGNISKFTTSTNIAPAAAADIVGLFSTCSGTQYLGADGACHNSSGSGTVNSGTINDLGFYASTGTAISGDSNVFSNGTNVGIGTFNFNNAFDVDGGVGIGSTANSTYLTTAVPAGSLIVENNVGIGSSAPGQKLDVQGTIRVLGGGSVGIGTTFVGGTGEGVLTIMNGNVGIGTWVTPANLQIAGTMAATISVTSSNITAGGGLSATGNANISGAANLSIAKTTTLATSAGFNVGIGTSNPGQRLDVQGTVRSFDFSGAGTDLTGTATSLTAGNASVAPAGTLTGTTLNSTVVTSSLTSVGTLGSLLVSGNVGIASTAPGSSLDVQGTARFFGSGNTLLNIGGGNVGINTATPGQLLDVQGNIRVSLLGSSLAVASGTNGCMGQATLSSGVATVSTTCAPSTSIGIFLTDAQTSLTNVGSVTIATVTGGSSFVIQSTNILDSSKVNWWVEKTS